MHYLSGRFIFDKSEQRGIFDKTFLQPTYFQRKKFNVKVKALSIIINRYLNLRYLCFLNSNDMKCTFSSPTITWMFS